MSTEQPRTPAGAPTGGQYASIERPEAEVALDSETPAIEPDEESLADRLARNGRESSELLERLLHESFGDTAAGTHVTCKPTLTPPAAGQGEPELRLSFGLSFDDDVPLERRFVVTELMRGIFDRHSAGQR